MSQHPYRRRRLKKGYKIAIAALCLCLVGGGIWLVRSRFTVDEAIKNTPGYGVEIPDWIDQDLLPVNEWSRPGEPLTEVNAIVIHYVEIGRASCRERV